jgi:hypothetical protein
MLRFPIEKRQLNSKAGEEKRGADDTVSRAVGELSPGK